MKTDKMGGKSHFNPFAESYRAKNKKTRDTYYAKKLSLQAKKK